ncbi:MULTISPECIES: helix-turn-helix transcriptional regulator [Chryseobacterium]|uniref:AraC-type DNA-binding protein n=1 Tax=Chryseobacterium wanjuense TaxID=356305 RepID=A0A1I0R139_9FLAO|nr:MULTISPECIES: helix-turn-helix domain-containing protein [Chryseobacterium]KYH08238.1 hypothetical protein A1704_06165 [Chryseobacterium cucumeris]SEW33293.1 AraC-type DNA-binding protein [Chryseobacterium wanjuense]
MKDLYPTFDINNMSTCHSIKEVFSIDQFSDYLPGNPKTTTVHRHSFYHVTYFISGGGENIIDFKTYKIMPHSIFFMRPGQVHSWDLDPSVEGYVINFAPTFFDQLQISSSLIDEFPFFNIFHDEQKVILPDDQKDEINNYFQQIIAESFSEISRNSQISIAATILQICALASREIQNKHYFTENNFNSLLFKKFVEQIELNFLEFKMPKDYAALLHITPSHLNFVCKQQVNLSAGEIIRNRIILEAKRLLVNFNLSVSAIAEKLNYHDSSNFVKFFKKATGHTPESFRKQYYGIQH